MSGVGDSAPEGRGVCDQPRSQATEVPLQPESAHWSFQDPVGAPQSQLMDGFELLGAEPAEVTGDESDCRRYGCRRPHRVCQIAVFCRSLRVDRQRAPSRDRRAGWLEHDSVSVRVLSDLLPATLWRRVSWCHNGTNPPWAADFAAVRVTRASEWATSPRGARSLAATRPRTRRPRAQSTT